MWLSSKALDYSITVELPALTPEARAISLVKAAVLTVPGEGRSATDVEANIDWFISSNSVLVHGGKTKGMRPAKGWFAAAKGRDNYEVVFDYMDGDASEQAIWHVVLKTGVVRYVNEHAKTFSWMPDY